MHSICLIIFSVSFILQGNSTANPTTVIVCLAMLRERGLLPPPSQFQLRYLFLFTRWNPAASNEAGISKEQHNILGNHLSFCSCCLTFLCDTFLVLTSVSLLQEIQAPQTPTATVDAPGRAVAASSPSAELQPSGTPLFSLAVAVVPCRLALGLGVLLSTLRHTLSWTCYHVAHNPLDSPFLCTYCIYLFCCLTINVLLNLL